MEKKKMFSPFHIFIGCGAHTTYQVLGGKATRAWNWSPTYI